MNLKATVPLYWGDIGISHPHLESQCSPASMVVLWDPKLARRISNIAEWWHAAYPAIPSSKVQDSQDGAHWGPRSSSREPLIYCCGWILWFMVDITNYITGGPILFQSLCLDPPPIPSPLENFPGDHGMTSIASGDALQLLHQLRCAQDSWRYPWRITGKRTSIGKVCQKNWWNLESLDHPFLGRNSTGLSEYATLNRR